MGVAWGFSYRSAIGANVIWRAARARTTNEGPGFVVGLHQRKLGVSLWMGELTIPNSPGHVEAGPSPDSLIPADVLPLALPWVVARSPWGEW